MQPCRFILQAFDPEYGHSAFEMIFVVERLEDLRDVLGPAAADDPELEMYYTLDPGDVEAINRRFDLAFDPAGRKAALSKWIAAHDLPYLAHTGNELVLMLDGRKQFARMGGEFFPPHHYPGEELFDRVVAEGLLHREEELERFDAPQTLRDGRVVEGLRTVYYTRLGEEWRIPAWKLISNAAAKSGWSDTFERLEGMLFGYEDWQNDWWLEHLRLRGERWGALTVYLAVTAGELSAIEDMGWRALPLRTGSLKLASSVWDAPGDDEARRVIEPGEGDTLVRFRVKARPFLEELASDRHARIHELPPQRVRDLNRIIVESIEVTPRG